MLAYIYASFSAASTIRVVWRFLEKIPFACHEYPFHPSTFFVTSPDSLVLLQVCSMQTMKLFATLAYVAVAASANPLSPKSKSAVANENYINKLVSAAVATGNNQIRRLDEAYQVDISGYSVKFEQCQFVKSYDSDLAESDQSDTVLATKRFVLFRLCPNSDCTSCNYNYGEYLVDLESYLQATVDYFEAYQEAMCTTCGNNCVTDDAAAAAGDDAAAAEDAAAGDDAAAGGQGRLLGKNEFYNIQVDCATCTEECDKIDNMATNGYIDATVFLECSMIYDAEDDQKATLYAGPICASKGSKIKIGVFKDADCMFLDTTKDVDDYLITDGVSMHLSHALLKSTYTDTCISCKEDAEQNENGDANEDADAVTELCENLYTDSAKCEKSHGFNDGYANYYGFENQLAQEEVVCEFMSSLKAGTYDEQGEIVVSGSNSRSGKSTSGGQKFALTFFILGTAGLAAYAAVLHSKLVRGRKPDLSSTGGSMA